MSICVQAVAPQVQKSPPRFSGKDLERHPLVKKAHDISSGYVLSRNSRSSDRIREKGLKRNLAEIKDRFLPMLRREASDEAIVRALRKIADVAYAEGHLAGRYSAPDNSISWRC